MLRRQIVCPEILDEKRFAQLQAALDATTLPNRERDHTYPLSLRLFGLCGAPYHGVYRKDMGGVRFYSCNSKRWDSGGERCEDQAIRADDIEYVVWEQVCELLSKPERLIALAEDYLGLRGQQIEVERDQTQVIERKIRELDRAI